MAKSTGNPGGQIDKNLYPQHGDYNFFLEKPITSWPLLLETTKFRFNSKNRKIKILAAFFMRILDLVFIS